MFKNINIFRPILAILILFIPLYPKFPLFSVTGTYVAIRLDDIIVALAVLIWLIFQIKNKFPVFKIKITRTFIAYFLAIIASFVTAFLVYQTESLNILLLNLFRRFEYISLFFITLPAIKTLKDLKFTYLFLLIATALVCVYGYGQKYFSFPVISTMNSEFSKGQLLQMNIWTRISSTFAGHYDLAAFLSVALIIIGVVAIITKNKLLKITSLIIWLAGFQILSLTASRVSVFAFWGGISLTLLLIRKYLWIIPVSLLVLFSIFNSKDLNQRLLATIPALKNQITNSKTTSVTPTPIPSIVTPTPIPISTTKITNPTPTPTIVRHQLINNYPSADTDVGVARSGEIRFNAEWPRAINAYKKNIITGTGLGSITLATDNDYLRCLGESGLLGLITFGSIILFFIIKTIPFLFKKDKTPSQIFAIILFGGLITTLANAVFIDVFEASKTAYLFWIMMGIYYQLLNFSNEKK
ncbi:MAG: hypothetical protein PHX34_02265 [Candidatus Shapirobacteria bacterium]|nr:hypothetical protein [Candidatus Shapirobacteria bacterium]